MQNVADDDDGDKNRAASRQQQYMTFSFFQKIMKTIMNKRGTHIYIWVDGIGLFFGMAYMVLFV